MIGSVVNNAPSGVRQFAGVASVVFCLLLSLASASDDTTPASLQPVTDSPVGTLRSTIGDVPWTPPAQRPRVVYGTDDRLDVFQEANPARLAQAASTCALISNDLLTDNGDGTFTIFLSAYTQGGFLACEDEPFASQPTAAFCSGFMVGNDLIATAGHCINGTADLANFSFIFGFNMVNSTTPVVQVNTNQVYSGTQLLSWEPGGDLDHALVRVDRNINAPGSAVLPVRTTGSIALTELVGVTGHPSGLPMKIAFGASTRVRANSDPAYFEANIDALPGNSGSPVFNQVTGLVEGILVRGPATTFFLDNLCFREVTAPDNSSLRVEVTRIGVLTSGIFPRTPQVNLTLHRDALLGPDIALYNEILGHFADAVFEATEGRHPVARVRINLDGQPVVDEAPIITVLGQNPIYVQPNSSYLDPGATVLDSEDGDLTGAMVTQIFVDTSASGDYFVRYRVTDSDGRTTEAFRQVKVVGEIPYLFLNPSNPQYHEVNSGPYGDPGAFVLDITDGFIDNENGEIQRDGTVDVGEEGVYTLTYSFEDSNGNISTAERIVEVIPEGFDEPTFEIIGQNPVWQDAFLPYNDAGAIGTDATNGILCNVTPNDGIPSCAVVFNNVNPGVAGSYRVVYEATDFLGNSRRATRFVNIVGDHPVVNVLGPNPLTLRAGEDYVDPGSVATDVTDFDISANIISSNPVDPTVAGQYFVEYGVVDSNGLITTAFRQVNVVGSLDTMQESDIYWLPSGVPSFLKAGGFGTPGGQIVMYDVFRGGQAGADLNFLGSPEGRRQAGYVLAHLWLQYYLGLGAEFAETSSDIAVRNSLLADPFSPAFDSSGFGLNISSTQDGVPTGGVFSPLEHTGATPQYRLHGLSAWATIAQTYGNDTKPARLIAKRPRTFFPDVAAAAPQGTAAPATDLNSIPADAFEDTFYFNERKSFFRIATENSLPVVSGNPTRTLLPCVTGRLVDITVPSPVTYEFPVDSDVRELMVAVSSPCVRSLSNLEAVLTDPLGRQIIAQSVETIPGVIQFRVLPSVTGTWRLQLIARTFTATGVQVDVYGRSAGPTHRLSASIPSAPGNLATDSIAYPGPLVLQVSDSSGLAIRNVDIDGILTLPSGGRVSLRFEDTGGGADLIANDGTYSVTLPYSQGGTYQLEVTSSDFNGSSRYTSVGTSRAPTEGFLGPEPTPAPVDQAVGDPFMRSLIYTFAVIGFGADDHGNTFLAATTLPLTNEDFPGRHDNATDVDYFRIQVPARGATQDVVARLTHVSVGTTFQLQLLAGDGFTELGRGERGPAGYSMIRQDLAPGTYYLTVSSSNPNFGGTYSVSAGDSIPSDEADVGIDTGLGGSGGGGGGGGGGGCFIATAAYGTPLETQIDQLRAVRDAQMLDNALGTAFADAYYRLSPPVADAVAQKAVLRDAVRGGIEVLLVLITNWQRVLVVLISLGLFVSAYWMRKRLP